MPARFSVTNQTQDCFGEYTKTAHCGPCPHPLPSPHPTGSPRTSQAWLCCASLTIAACSKFKFHSCARFRHHRDVLCGQGLFFALGGGKPKGTQSTWGTKSSRQREESVAEAGFLKQGGMGAYLHFMSFFNTTILL